MATRDVTELANQYRKAVEKATPQYQKVIGEPPPPQPTGAGLPAEVPKFIIKSNINRWLRGI